MKPQPWRVRLNVAEPGGRPWYREVVVVAEGGVRAIIKAAIEADDDYTRHVLGGNT